MDRRKVGIGISGHGAQRRLGCVLFLVVVACGLACAVVQGSPMDIESLAFRMKGYRWDDTVREWRADLPSVIASVKCREDGLRLAFAKAYYFDKERKALGASDEPSSYFSYKKGSDRVTGFQKPATLAKNEELELHFTPPKGVDLKAIARVLLVIGNADFAEVRIDPRAPVDDFDFAEKAICRQGK